MPPQRSLGRRSIFFLFVVLVSLALYLPTPAEFRWVCLFTASLSGVWAVLLGLEDMTRPTGPRTRTASPEPTFRRTPFDPPPAPGEGN